MAAVSRTVVCQGRGNRMTNDPSTPLAPLANPPRRPSVRVKLRRINANLAKAYPPDGEAKAWWSKLKQALGTTSSAFVDASLLQMQAAARLPCSGISEVALNAALAMIEAAAPRDEIAGALAVQMACTHTAAMAVLATLGGAGGTERRVVALASAAARLLGAYSNQVEILRRLRHGGHQYVRSAQASVLRAQVPPSVVAKPLRVTRLGTLPRRSPTSSLRSCSC